MTVGRPRLELGFSRRPELHHEVVAKILQLEMRNDLRVAAVEALRHAQHRGERADRAPERRWQARVLLVRTLRRAAAVVTGDERDDFDFDRFESTKIAVLDQVIGVPVMTGKTD